MSFGEALVFPISTPQINPLSPSGRNVLGMELNKRNVPARQIAQINNDTNRQRKNHDSDDPYNSSIRCSTARLNRSTSVFFSPGPRLARNREHIIGVSVSETMPLAKIDTMIVPEHSRKIRPINPDISTSGRKTAASDVVIARIVKLISRALWNAASNAFSPS